MWRRRVPWLGWATVQKLWIEGKERLTSDEEIWRGEWGKLLRFYILEFSNRSSNCLIVAWILHKGQSEKVSIIWFVGTGSARLICLYFLHEIHVGHRPRPEPGKIYWQCQASIFSVWILTRVMIWYYCLGDTSRRCTLPAFLVTVEASRTQW